MILRLTFALALVASTASAAPPARARRFAFLAAANDGGPGRTRLRYASSDARAVSRVLTEMGGVRAADLVFVEEPDRAQFLAKLDSMRQAVAAARVPAVRSELIFYYSGHSDEEGLLLRGERLPYTELRARIEQIPADVRVAVLDSCASGALTRHKGGVFRPPFMTDDSVQLKGNAFLTSSAANEVAQESDRIAASFFTHYLVSGLRGAADVNRDRRVTFFEAYQFAAQETLARTERTRGGAQHAAYDISLNGTGDFVMTDVSTTSAGLVLAPELQGLISVRETDDRLVAELRKAAGHPVELGLQPGKYLVTMAGRDSAFEATVELHEGQRASLGQLQFHARPLELARARGDEIIGASVPPPVPLRVVPFSVGVVPMPSSGPPERLLKNVSLNLIADRAAQVRGMQVSIGINWVDEELHGLQAAVAANVANGPVSGLQAAVGGNLARGDVHGVQAASGLNMGFGELHGLQLAAGANYVQGEMTGIQGASAINLAMAGARGLQGAAGANWVTRDLTGLQAAAAFNGTRGSLRGAQLAVVNYAGSFTGAQIGVANVAGQSHGLQLGLVNISEEDHGVPIGLVSYARRNGMFHVGAYATETSAANVMLKVGGRAVYNTFAVGVRPGKDGNRYTNALGLGVRTRLDRRWLSLIDSELVASSFTHAFDYDQKDRVLILSSLRLTAGWQLAERLTITAGPTLNVLVRKRGLDGDVAPGALESVLHDGATRVSLYPGFIVGVEI